MTNDSFFLSPYTRFLNWSWLYSTLVLRDSASLTCAFSTPFTLLRSRSDRYASRKPGSSGSAAGNGAGGVGGISTNSSYSDARRVENAYINRPVSVCASLLRYSARIVFSYVFSARNGDSSSAGGGGSAVTVRSTSL